MSQHEITADDRIRANVRLPSAAVATIEVNTKPVTVVGQDQTGLTIKEAAIAQGVNIKPDFVLSVDKGGGKTEVVGDSDPVKVHPGEKFIAVDNDDNS